MPCDKYYWYTCMQCEGFEDCEPRDENNIRDCKRRNKSREPPIRRKV